jgi:glucose-6-phosphate dehydrogenase assembly protein OpcA
MTGASSLPPNSMRGVPMSSVIQRLENDLRALWTTPVKAGDPVKSRVCTMNLVVVAQSRELAERYTPVVDDVTASVPARAILVALEPEAPSAALEGEATAVCSLAAGAEGALCSERIRLYASGSTCARVGSAVEALAMPELPTVLVWLGRVHTDDPVFVSLASDAQRVILDTEYTSLSSLVKLAAWAREGARAAKDRAAVADLSWTRLSVWQELSARFFDAPEMREHASGVTRLTLRQASDKGARLGSEGSLFLGWMATRLGWKVQRLGGALKFRRPDGAQVALTLEAVPRPKGEAPLALSYVGLAVDQGGFVARASVERQLSSGLSEQSPDADVLSWKLEIRGPQPVTTERQVRLHVNKEAALLVETLHRPVFDPALGEAVAFAEELSEDGLLCA